MGEWHWHEQHQEQLTVQGLVQGCWEGYMDKAPCYNTGRPLDQANVAMSLGEQRPPPLRAFRLAEWGGSDKVFISTTMPWPYDKALGG